MRPEVAQSIVTLVLSVAYVVHVWIITKQWKRQVDEVVEIYESELQARSDEYDDLEGRYFDVVDIVTALAWQNGDSFAVSGTHLSMLELDPEAPSGVEFEQDETTGSVTATVLR